MEAAVLEKKVKPLSAVGNGQSAIGRENGLKSYTYQETFKETLEYFKGDNLAADVWINKYALKDSNGKLYESNPDQMHRRLAREIARIEKRYPNPLNEDEIYNLLKDFKYIIP